MIDLDEYPSFHEQDRQEESLRLADSLREQGYWPVTSILMAGQMTVRQCFMLHERRNSLAQLGAIVGPCVFGDINREVMPGVSLYVAEVPR